MGPRGSRDGPQGRRKPEPPAWHSCSEVQVRVGHKRVPCKRCGHPGVSARAPDLGHAGVKNAAETKGNREKLFLVALNVSDTIQSILAYVCGNKESH